MRRPVAAAAAGIAAAITIILRSDHRRRTAESALRRVASIDSITGLYSRDRMLRLAKVAGRQARPHAVLVVDVDHFRSINASFGHELGDALLVVIAGRLQALAAGHAIGRLRSDEFAVLARGVDLAEAERLGAAIGAAIAEPMTANGRTFHLSGGIGIAHSATAGGAGLLLAATEAAHEAKYRGPGQCVTYAPSLRGGRHSEFELGQEMHAALERDDQFGLMFQPVLRITDHALVGIEALARWQHPRLGPVSPGRFIKVAEQVGLMPRLGRKLMRMVVAQVADWETRFPGLVPIVNVNVSALQFAAGDVIAELCSLIDQAGLPAEHFCIEMTESAFANEAAARALTVARARGFRIAMDDFGVGYSSLAQLPLLPLTDIKLDRSLVVNASDHAEGALILQAVVPLAHALGLEVVAEGVETDDQMNVVAQAHCDAVQGFLLSRPITAAAIEAWFKAGPTAGG